MNTPILVCRQVNKRYRVSPWAALKDFDLTLEQNTVAGVLGAARSGKTTLLKMIAGLMPFDSGKILLGGEPYSTASNGMLAFLPDRSYLDEMKSVSDAVAFFARYFSDFDEKRASELLSREKIGQGRRIDTLSKATCRKVQLILTMSRRVKLYLLDEPFLQEDAEHNRFASRLIAECRPQDAAVLIATHLIDEAEPILDRFVFVGARGKTLLAGDVRESCSARQCTLAQLYREALACS